MGWGVGKAGNGQTGMDPALLTAMELLVHLLQAKLPEIVISNKTLAHLGNHVLKDVKHPGADGYQLLGSVSRDFCCCRV